MAKPGKLSNAAIFNRFLKDARDGMIIADLARKYSVTESTVYYHFSRLNLIYSGEIARSARVRPGRNQTNGRGFTPEEDRQILEWREQGLNCAQMSERMPRRAKDTINKRLLRLDHHQMVDEHYRLYPPDDVPPNVHLVNHGEDSFKLNPLERAALVLIGERLYNGEAWDTVRGGSCYGTTHMQRMEILRLRMKQADATAFMKVYGDDRHHDPRGHE